MTNALTDPTPAQHPIGFDADQFANDLREAMTSWNRAKLIESQAHAKTMKFIESMDEFLKGGVKWVAQRHSLYWSGSLFGELSQRFLASLAAGLSAPTDGVSGQSKTSERTTTQRPARLKWRRATNHDPHPLPIPPKCAFTLRDTLGGLAGSERKRNFMKMFFGVVTATAMMSAGRFMERGEWAGLFVDAIIGCLALAARDIYVRKDEQWTGQPN
jgi:uncharacterized membrane protein (UPF0136 family)